MPLERMLKKCQEAGLKTTKNIEKIARAKKMMFSDEEWHRCPCDGNNSKRYCISEMCIEDIKRDGVCHCNCYTNK